MGLPMGRAALLTPNKPRRFAMQIEGVVMPDGQVQYRVGCWGHFTTLENRGILHMVANGMIPPGAPFPDGAGANGVLPS